MRTIWVLMIFSGVLFCFAGTAEAQRRKPAPRRPAAKPTPKPAVATIGVRLAKEKVSNQRSNVTRFIGLLAPVAVELEKTEAESKTKRLSKKALDDHDKNKKDLMKAMRDLREGLVNLENEFRAKAELRRFLPQLQGISMLSVQSEDLAFAGKFVDSRKPLVSVAAKLSDTMAVMPGIIPQ